MSQNYKVTIQYDGRGFFGWQRLKDKPTVQSTLEDALHSATGEYVAVAGSGRTDRGTHAVGQVASFALESAREVDDLRDGINAHLPATVRCRNLERVDEDFQAQSSAVGKQYIYRIWNAPELPPELDGLVWFVPESLDYESMCNCPKYLEGQHDFGSFGSPSKAKRGDSVRTLHQIRIWRDGHQIYLALTADGFLYKMVRNLVRQIVKVGEGRLRASDLQQILQKRDRQAAPGSAPASGLYLNSVCYSESELHAVLATHPGNVQLDD